MDGKKMGRPTKEPKTQTLKIRLSESEGERLEYCAHKLGKTKAEVIREGIERTFKELN